MVSIIIPIYNAERLLPYCIESLINQSFQDIEIILVDDCSKDRSLQVCLEYEKKDDRIHVISTPENSGAAKARNLGLAKAKGDYISFVDNDDILHKDFIRTLVEKQQQYDADIVQCRFIRFSDGQTVNFESASKPDIIYDTNEVISNLFGHNGGVQTVVVFNKLYKAEIFEMQRFDVGKSYEDTFIMHKILINAKRIVFIDDGLYGYRTNEGSVTSQAFKMSRMDIVDAMELRVNDLRTIDKSYYTTAIYQLADNLINTYYNMKITFPNEKDTIKLLRLKYKYYYRIMNQNKKYYLGARENIHWMFRYFPRLYYKMIYHKRLNYF